MKQKCIFLALLFSSLVCTSSFAQTCPKCNGYGQILAEVPSISHFGVSRKTGDCEICGHAMFQGERHHHQICPRCNGTGKYSRGSSRSSSDSDENYSNDDYDNILNPVESERVTDLMKMLSGGKTEMRECQTCHGTGRCPMQGGHYTAGEILDVTGPMPSICPLCGGGGYCPNYKCVNGQESYTRPCTESEKEEINNEIKLIMDVAMKREYGDSYATNDKGQDEDKYTTSDEDEDEYATNDEGQDENDSNNKLNEPEDGTTIWDLFLIALAIVIIIILYKKLFK